MGKKIRYHINGTKLDFLGQKALAEYLGCSVAAINNAEKRWCKKMGNVSFWVKNQRIKRVERIKYIGISDVHFSIPEPTHEEIKALAEATATMLADKTNTIIAVMPNKDGKPVFITR